MAESDEKITLQQAAELTGIGLSTLKRWAKQGKIKGLCRAEAVGRGRPGWLIPRHIALGLKLDTPGRPPSEQSDIVALAQRVSRARRRAKDAAKTGEQLT